MTAEKKLQFSLFDGEHIKYDKTGRFINLFAKLKEDLKYNLDNWIC
jgi:hypothetical protein